MSTTQEDVINSLPAGETGADAANAGGQTGAESQPASGEQPGAKPESKKGRGAKSPAEAAFERVAQARAGKESDAGGSQQAPGDKSGASTGQPPASSASKEKPEADGEQSGDENAASDASASTVTAPEDWPPEGKEAFNALPTTEAKQSMVRLYDNMNRGFQESMNKLAQLRKGHEGIVDAMQKHGADQHEVVRLLDLDSAFNQDPKKVLQQLASVAGVPIYFETPLAEGEVPEFKSTAELIEYTRQKTLEDFKKTQQTQLDEDRRKQEAESTKANLRKEFEQAQKDHKDFTDHKTAVLSKLAENPHLSVEDAYHLVTLPALRKLAEEGAAAKQKLAALEAEQEKTRKKHTRPPSGNGTGAAAQDDKKLSPAERAYNKAQAKLEAAKH